jgi:excisionase family DNA binding protein
MDPLLKAKELAEALGVNPETVRRWARAKKIPFVQVGNSRRYNLAAVIEANTKNLQESDQ